MRRILLFTIVLMLCFMASCSSPEAQPPAAEPPATEPSETEPPVFEASITDASNKEPEIVYVDPEKAFAIYVNDEKIAQAAVYNEGYLEIPILAVLKGLGATITWVSREYATILYDEQIFTLDTTDEMMYHGDEMLLDTIACGSGPYTPVFRVVEKEVFVDASQVMRFFNAYTDTPITWNHVEKEVYIKEGNRWDWQKNNS